MPSQFESFLDQDLEQISQMPFFKSFNKLHCYSVIKNHQVTIRTDFSYLHDYAAFSKEFDDIFVMSTRKNSRPLLYKYKYLYSDGKRWSHQQMVNFIK